MMSAIIICDLKIFKCETKNVTKIHNSPIKILRIPFSTVVS